MKTFLLTLLLGFCTTAATLGADSDLRLGTFKGTWGSIDCRYELTSQRPGKLQFFGKIFLKDTDQYDDITATQRAGIVSIVRELSGSGSGKTQSVQFLPAETRRDKKGRVYYLFRAAVRAGPGMKGTANDLVMLAP